jgi:AcrR family transcriptional regulator
MNDNDKDTKERLLDAAERLFADHGFNATSLRRITTMAGANLAAVNYHFGSKEALIVAVLSRRLEPLNRERLQLLDRLEDEAGEAGPDVTGIVGAFIGPALRMAYAAGEAGTTFMRLTGHAMHQSSDRILQLLTERFREVFERFTAALFRALPHLPPEELRWRLLFSVGTMVHALVMSEHVQKCSWARLDQPDVDAMVDRMVRFLSAGFQAPAAGSVAGGDA